MSGFIDFADVKARCSIEQAAKPLGLKCTAAAIANWKTDSPKRILGACRNPIIDPVNAARFMTAASTW